MKNIIKKVVISIFAMILISGIFIVEGSQNVLADGENFTINFHYTRSDANYSNYTIKAYSVSDSQGKSGGFTVNGSEGVFAYSFARDVELDDQVRLIIRSVDTDTLEIDNVVDISGITTNTVDIAIDGDGKTVGIMEASSDVTPEVTTEAPQPSNENAGAADNTETQKVVVPDDPNADYSVGMVKVVIIDIVSLVLIAGISFAIFSREKKKQ